MRSQRRKSTAGPSPFYRAMPMGPETMDTKNRRVELTFSSELPYQRWYGAEILLHDADAVDLARLRAMGAGLLNHNPDCIVGPLDNVKIGEDFRGHAGLTFDEDEDGETCMKKVASKSLRGVSVGYIIHRAKRLEQDEEYDHPRLGKIVGPALIATKWEPIEISLTPIPADASVGVGRNARSLDGIEIEPASRESMTERTSTMDKRMREYLESRGLAKDASEESAWKFLGELKAKDATPAAPAPVVPPPTPERSTVLAEVRDVAVAMGKKDRAFDLAAEGKSAAEIRKVLCDELAAERGHPAGAAQDEDASTPLSEVSDDDLVRMLESPEVAFA